MNPATHQCSRRSTWRRYNDTAGREGRHLQDPRAGAAEGGRGQGRAGACKLETLRRRRRATSSEPCARDATARARSGHAIAADLLPHLVNGVSLGLLFALIALGFMLIVGVMETINLAHGSLFALGMYVAHLHRHAEARLVPGAAGGVPGAAARHALRDRAAARAGAGRRLRHAARARACAAPTARIRSTACC